MTKKARLTAIFLILLSFSQPKALIGEPQRVFTIGVIVGTTGIAAASGVSVRNGIELADRDCDQGDHVRFIFEDDGFQAKTAVSAADKLIHRDKVDALITFSGATSMAVSAVADRRRVPMISVTALSDVSAGKDLVRTIFIPPAKLASMMSELISRLDPPRVALITSSQEALLGIRKALLTSLANDPSARPIVFDEEIAPGDVDLFSLVTRMISRKPEVVISLTLPPQSATLARLLKNQGYSGRLVVGPPTYNFSEIKAANGALTEALLIGPKSGVSDSFFRRYREQYGEPSVAEGMYGYDGAKFLIEAAKTGDIVGFLKNSRMMNGSAGSYQINADNLFEVPAEVKVITRNGDVAVYLE